MRSAHFAVRNNSKASPAAVQQVLAQLERHRAEILALFPLRALPPIDVNLVDGTFVPYATGPDGAMFMQIPVVNGRPAMGALQHELIHIMAGYSNVGLMEGLAVHGDQAIRPHDRSVFPAFGESVDAWTRYFVESSNYVPLVRVFTAREFFKEAASGENRTMSADDIFSWQSYVEAASFVRWLIAERGWDEFWAAYKQATLTGSNARIIGPLLDRYEDEWLRAARNAPRLTRPVREILPVSDPRFLSLANALERRREPL
ncbi:MAG TPA: hypothetical protein VLC93_04540 [Myxococcota bacterium]|nr:hypothetical protein [Myxococcota bacterium]